MADHPMNEVQPTAGASTSCGQGISCFMYGYIALRKYIGMDSSSASRPRQ